MYSPSGHPRYRWVCFFDEFVSSSDLEKCSIPSLAHQWVPCSEWVPSEWESYFLVFGPGSHMLLDFDVREQQEIDFFTGGSVIVNYGLTWFLPQFAVYSSWWQLLKVRTSLQSFCENQVGHFRLWVHPVKGYQAFWKFKLIFEHCFLLSCIS